MATQVRTRHKAQQAGQSYSEQHRREVVAQIRSGKYTRGQIASAHGLSMGSLRNWEERYGGPDQILPAAPPLPTAKMARTTNRTTAKSANGATKATNGASEGPALQVIDHAIDALQKARPILAQFENLQSVAQQILAR